MKTKTLILLAALISIPLLSWGEDGAKKKNLDVLTLFVVE
jgi:hypothetical protein